MTTEERDAAAMFDLLATFIARGEMFSDKTKSITIDMIKDARVGHDANHPMLVAAQEFLEGEL